MPRELTPEPPPPSGSEPVLTASPSAAPPPLDLDDEMRGHRGGGAASALFWDDARDEVDEDEDEDGSGSGGGSSSGVGGGMGGGSGGAFGGSSLLSLAAKLRAQDEAARPQQQSEFHPHVQLLSVADLDACVAVESSAFPEAQRCTREKFIYRLTTCPDLTLGLYSALPAPPAADADATTHAMYAAARPPDSHRPEHRALLLGHVLATLSTAPTVRDADMDFPTTFPSHPDFRTPSGATAAAVIPGGPVRTASAVAEAASAEASGAGASGADAMDTTPDAGGAPPPPAVGHEAGGRTLAIHSVAVAPPFQRRGFGRTLLRAFLQRMEGSGVADRAALLTHERLVPWYRDAFGFQDRGASAATFGGGGWRNMVYEFTETKPWG